MATFFSGYFLLKVLLTAVVVVGISELARHSGLLAAVLASLPVTSILAFIWMHLEGSSNAQVAALSKDIFWLVIPSLAFFVVFPLLLRVKLAFFAALLLAMVVTALVYGIMLKILAIFASGA